MVHHRARDPAAFLVVPRISQSQQYGVPRLDVAVLHALDRHQRRQLRVVGAVRSEREAIVQRSRRTDGRIKEGTWGWGMPFTTLTVKRPITHPSVRKAPEVGAAQTTVEHGPGTPFQGASMDPKGKK
jgi:hypothetical protein